MQAATIGMFSPCTRVELRKNDVVLGRGNGISALPGNIAFRHIVWSLSSAYQNSVRNGKRELGKHVVMDVFDRGGRFVECSREGHFHTVTPMRAVEKACQALREKRIKVPDGYDPLAMAARKKKTSRLFAASKMVKPKPPKLEQLNKEEQLNKNAPKSVKAVVKATTSSTTNLTKIGMSAYLLTMDKHPHDPKETTVATKNQTFEPSGAMLLAANKMVKPIELEQLNKKAPKSVKAVVKPMTSSTTNSTKIEKSAYLLTTDEHLHDPKETKVAKKKQTVKPSTAVLLIAQLPVDHRKPAKLPKMPKATKRPKKPPTMSCAVVTPTKHRTKSKASTRLHLQGGYYLPGEVTAAPYASMDTKRPALLLPSTEHGLNERAALNLIGEMPRSLPVAPLLPQVAQTTCASRQEEVGAKRPEHEVIPLLPPHLLAFFSSILPAPREMEEEKPSASLIPSPLGFSNLVLEGRVFSDSPKTVIENMFPPPPQTLEASLSLLLDDERVDIDSILMDFDPIDAWNDFAVQSKMW